MARQIQDRKRKLEGARIMAFALVGQGAARERVIGQCFRYLYAHGWTDHGARRSATRVVQSAIIEQQYTQKRYASAAINSPAKP